MSARFPPLLVAIVGGLLLVAAVPNTTYLQAPGRLLTRGDWGYAALGLAAGVVGALILSSLASFRYSPRAQPTTPGPDEWLAWVRREVPLSGADEDRFDRRRISKRIAGHLSRPWGDEATVALLGPFGSGKTTILNWVKEELRGFKSPRVWFVEVSCWGLESAAGAPAYALGRAIDELQQHVDTLALRGLPAAYQRVLSAEPSGLVAKVFDATGPQDALAELQRLSPILQAVGARLVLFIEDADRAGSDFDPQHIQRLLWGLRKVPGVTFVLALDRPLAGFDVAKLCDYIEAIPAPEAESVRECLLTLRERCLGGDGFIDPVVDRGDHDPLQLVTKGGDLEVAFRRFGGGDKLNDVTALIGTPRNLKQVLRRVLASWDRLQGEIDLDELIIASIIREAAPHAFEFLVSHLDEIRRKPDAFDRAPTALQDAWKAEVGRSQHAECIQWLVGHLGLERLPAGRALDVPQGLRHQEPNDYFRRLLAEEATEGPPTDQEVLASMEQWIGTGQGPMLPNLLASSDEDRRFVRVWEHFSDRVPTDRLLPLTGSLIEAIKGRDGVRASGKHPAILAHWRRCQARLGPRQGNGEWLSQQLSGALGTSLALTSELYYFWASLRHPILDRQARDAVRVNLVGETRRQLASDDRLSRVLDRDRPWALTRLAFPVDHEEPPSPLKEASDWAWLGPVLLAAARRQPAILMPHLANLFGQFRDEVRARGFDDGPHHVQLYSLDRERLQTIGGAEAVAVVELLASSEGDDPWFLRAAREEAAAWLRELRTQGPAVATGGSDE